MVEKIFCANKKKKWFQAEGMSLSGLKSTWSAEATEKTQKRRGGLQLSESDYSQRSQIAGTYLPPEH